MNELNEYFSLIVPYMGFGIVLGSFFPLIGFIINALFRVIDKN